MTRINPNHPDGFWTHQRACETPRRIVVEGNYKKNGHFKNKYLFFLLGTNTCKYLIAFSNASGSECKSPSGCSTILTSVGVIRLITNSYCIISSFVVLPCWLSAPDTLLPSLYLLVKHRSHTFEPNSLHPIGFLFLYQRSSFLDCLFLWRGWEIKNAWIATTLGTAFQHAKHLFSSFLLW